VTRDDEDGFTLVELLVTMTIATIVMFAILNGSDAFLKHSRNAENAAGAQDSAREAMRGMVAFLRQGRRPTGQSTPVPSSWTPSRSDLTVAAYVTSATNPTPGTLPGWIRYCAASGSLIVGVRAVDAYAAPGTCTAGDVNGWHHTVLIAGALRDTNKLFDFTSDACTGATCLPLGSAVRAVGIRLAIGTAVGSAAAPLSVVRDAVSFRNGSKS
jgi:prepilin-type N-terminal cleavage/methylation domain-containing protein